MYNNKIHIFHWNSPQQNLISKHKGSGKASPVFKVDPFAPRFSIVAFVNVNVL